jgi:hypothetical protein
MDNFFGRTPVGSPTFCPNPSYVEILENTGYKEMYLIFILRERKAVLFSFEAF